MYKYLLSTAALFFFFVACSSPSVPSQSSVVQLAEELQSLRRDIPASEAMQLSEELFFEIKKLRQKFKPLSEPHFNNFMINVGLKKEGLCYEWSDALYVHFINTDYLHFTFHLLVSDQGKYFSEHNVLVVAARGKNVLDGVIIDPWREPGSVYFVKVKNDHGYTWKHRAERGCLR